MRLHTCHPYTQVKLRPSRFGQPRPYLYGGERSFVGLVAATPAFTNPSAAMPSAAMPLGISVNEHARMQFVSEHMYKFHLRWPRIDQRKIRPHDLDMYAREYFEGEYEL